MNLKIFVLSIHIFLSLVIIGAGILLVLYPPKKINYIYGYRSKNSMSSQEKWDFANVYCGKMICKSQLMILIAVIFLGFFIKWENQDKVGKISIAFVIAQVSAIFISVILTEIELRKKFKD